MRTQALKCVACVHTVHEYILRSLYHRAPWSSSIIHNTLSCWHESALVFSYKSRCCWLRISLPNPDPLFGINSGWLAWIYIRSSPTLDAHAQLSQGNNDSLSCRSSLHCLLIESNRKSTTKVEIKRTKNRVNSHSCVEHRMNLRYLVHNDSCSNGVRELPSV